MKAKGSYNPPPFELEFVGVKAVLRFYENIVETIEESDEGTTTAGWEFDRYTIERPYDSELQARVSGNVAGWLATAKQEEYDTLASVIRIERNKRLSDTDRTQLSDAPEDKDTKNAYKAYRQALRDIPDQLGFPYNVSFPVVLV